MHPSKSCCRTVPARNQTPTVKFKVRDKEHTLGVVSLSLTTLGPHREASQKWYPILPHKKGHEAFGELLLECFVSQYRPGQVLSLSEASSPISSQMGSQEDILNPRKGRRFSLHRRTPSWSKKSTDSPGISTSQKLTDLGSEGTSKSGQSVTHSHSASDSGSSSNLSKPQVTGVSPHEGPVQGGQRVVLRGSNLGESRESVLKVMLANVDCTSSLEYFSNCE